MLRSRPSRIGQRLAVGALIGVVGLSIAPWTAVARDVAPAGVGAGSAAVGPVEVAAAIDLDGPVAASVPARAWLGVGGEPSAVTAGWSVEAAASVLLGSSVGSSAATPYAFDVYRPGVFTTQATRWYCTAASVQIMRNIVRRESDHAAAAQTRYFTVMRAHNRHRMPVTDGIDPPGFLAGLRTFVDQRYRLVASTTFDNAVRSAVRSLRVAGRPVALIVDHGRHAWVLTGFTATADPARTAAFKVLTVRIVGPLYGRQSRNGYDPRPDTSLPITAFRSFLTGYSFKYGATPWDGRFVTFQIAG